MWPTCLDVAPLSSRPPPPPRKKVGSGAKGGFRFTELGPIVASRPQEGRVLLAALLRANGDNVSKTARSIGTTYRTVSRWIRLLTEAGHDPRASPAANLYGSPILG